MTMTMVTVMIRKTIKYDQYPDFLLLPTLMKLVIPKVLMGQMMTHLRSVRSPVRLRFQIFTTPLYPSCDGCRCSGHRKRENSTSTVHNLPHSFNCDVCLLSWRLPPRRAQTVLEMAWATMSPLLIQTLTYPAPVQSKNYAVCRLLWRRKKKKFVGYPNWWLPRKATSLKKATMLTVVHRN